MSRRSIRIELINVATLLGCGLLMVAVALPVAAQSVRDTVQQRVDAGAAAIESTAGTADESSQAQPGTPAPSAEQPPAIEIQPIPAEPASGMSATGAQETTAPAAESPAVTPSAPTEPAQAQTPAPAQTDVAQAETPPGPLTYTVKPGDTLWSISSEALSDPFNWPRLWNVNPTVNNPDLIYPGNVLALPNGHPAEAVQAEPAPPVAEAPPAETAPEETAAVTEETPPAAPAEEAAPAPEEAPMIAEELKEPGPPSFEVLPPPPTQSKEILALSSGFIARNLPVSARVIGTHESRILLGDHDTIYLLPGKGAALEAQGRYTIYRRLKQVVHPVSRRVVGDLIQVLGEVEVQQTGQVATGLVIKSYASIEPGDNVMPSRTIEAAPTTPVVEGAGGSLSGLVLEVLEGRVLNGQFNIVYIDRGEVSGVVVGDRFRVFRRGERAPAYAAIANVQLPDRLVGELEVLSVQADTATALLTRSTETIALGDRIER
ncbi:MAG: LysM peptidoglycan-binding domain-containing protein [Nitrospirae bacterium]|nr:LysM peptidoglycan-binding domain-containing protein [Nitrospirota bacterium]